MKRIFCLMVLIACSMQVAPAARAAARMFRFDTVHSQVFFSVSHNNFSFPMGRLRIEAGWLRFDPDHWADSATALTLDTRSVDMGDDAWSKVVCAHQFLDCERYPSATFHSTSVERTSARSGMLHGILDMRGHQLPVDVAFTLNRLGATIFELKTVAGFSARSNLDRTRLGMTSHTGSIGRNVKIRLEIEALADDDAQNAYRSHTSTPATKTPHDDTQIHR